MEHEEAKKHDRKSVLLEHEICDTLPIFTSSLDLSKAEYIPRTVVKLGDFEDTPSIYSHVKKQMENILSMSDQIRAKFLEETLHEIILNHKECEKYKLPPEMIGQKGIYAKKNIKKHTVLGFYSGIYIKDINEYAHLRKIFTEEQLSLYSFSLNINGQYPRVVGYKYGNKLSLINACTIYDKSPYEIAREYMLKNNLYIIKGKSGESAFQDNPNFYDLITFVTRRDIKKGEQFFYDYGIYYWKNRLNQNLSNSTVELQNIISEMQKRTDKKSKKFF